ncbi:hypothetical protein [Neoroseomonas soli]|uniref:Uncharacterized protein n=1 Tax=Neoroseomonas soli TaxID=1081025 RepID=A0A9X9WWL7_9PROT|nr:hypothetical protein [Neoroseomonas soli]MBR0671546.1 hypothetical protein [Neoroseomonas soli]
MYEDIGTMLRRLARTAVLVAALGGLLYGGLAAVAEQGYGRWLISLFLAAPMTALLAFVVFDALRRGVFPRRGGSAGRAEQPLAYWSNLVLYAACGLAFGAMAVWSGAELLAAAPERP